MKVIYGLEAVDPPLRRCVLTIGNFDGVHRAHQALITECRRRRLMSEGPVVALTFEPHPLRVVAPEKAPSILTPLNEKLARLEEAGVEITVVARSEPSLLGLEAEDFVHQVVRDRFDPAHIVEGPSFGFGRGRKGSAQLLARLASGFHSQLHVLNPVRVHLSNGTDAIVSSSLIRDFLRDGNVRDASAALGRPYALFGRVVRGQSRGRGLGFPTANLSPGDQLVPGEGVYSGWANVRGLLFAAAISIGHTPTFGGQERQVEAHLLNFSGDLYDKCLALEFVHRLRGQQTFASPDALRAQLHADIEAVRRMEQGEPVVNHANPKHPVGNA